MDWLMAVSIAVLLSWSGYSLIHSRQRAKQKGVLFYSELLPWMKQYTFSRSRNQFPVLSGSYESYQIKLVPEVDALVIQRLPRLYLRIYLYLPNSFLMRIRKEDLETRSTHFFLPSSFEKTCQGIRINNQEYQLFLAEDDCPVNLETGLAKLFPEGNHCAELLFQHSFIRITLLLAKGKKSPYVMTRATDFASLILKREFIQQYLKGALELHRELNIRR